MATEGALRRRFRLRKSFCVVAALDTLYRTAIRLRGGGDKKDTAPLDEVPFGAYAALYRRAHRLLSEEYEKIGSNINKDWREELERCYPDAAAANRREGVGLTREAFCDGLFELADTWVSKIDANDYATFLTRLLSRVATADGWVEMRHLSYDPELAGGEATASFRKAEQLREQRERVEQARAAAMIQAQRRGQQARRQSEERRKALATIQTAQRRKAQRRQQLQQSTKPAAPSPTAPAAAPPPVPALWMPQYDPPWWHRELDTLVPAGAASEGVHLSPRRPKPGLSDVLRHEALMSARRRPRRDAGEPLPPLSPIAQYRRTAQAARIASGLAASCLARDRPQSVPQSVAMIPSSRRALMASDWLLGLPDAEWLPAADGLSDLGSMLTGSGGAAIGADPQPLGAPASLVALKSARTSTSCEARGAARARTAPRDGALPGARTRQLSPLATLSASTAGAAANCAVPGTPEGHAPRYAEDVEEGHSPSLASPSTEDHDCDEHNHVSSDGDGTYHGRSFASVSYARSFAMSALAQLNSSRASLLGSAASFTSGISREMSAISVSLPSTPRKAPPPLPSVAPPNGLTATSLPASPIFRSLEQPPPMTLLSEMLLSNSLTSSIGIPRSRGGVLSSPSTPRKQPRSPRRVVRLKAFDVFVG